VEAGEAAADDDHRIARVGGRLRAGENRPPQERSRCRRRCRQVKKASAIYSPLRVRIVVDDRLGRRRRTIGRRKEAGRFVAGVAGLERLYVFSNSAVSLSSMASCTLASALGSMAS
jgi:hypothetical protein